jgi:hypothetical protein
MPNWAPGGSIDAHELETIQAGVQSESLDERARESRKRAREEEASKPVTAVSAAKAATKTASISAQPAVGAPRGTGLEGSAQYGAPRGTGLEGARFGRRFGATLENLPSPPSAPGTKAAAVEGDANEMIGLDDEQEALGFQAQADARVTDGASDSESALRPKRAHSAGVSVHSESESAPRPKRLFGSAVPSAGPRHDRALVERALEETESADGTRHAALRQLRTHLDELDKASQEARLKSKASRFAPSPLAQSAPPARPPAAPISRAAARTLGDLGNLGNLGKRPRDAEDAKPASSSLPRLAELQLSRRSERSEDERQLARISELLGQCRDEWHARRARTVAALATSALESTSSLGDQAEAELVSKHTAIPQRRKPLAHRYHLLQTKLAALQPRCTELLANVTKMAALAAADEQRLHEQEQQARKKMRHEIREIVHEAEQQLQRIEQEVRKAKMKLPKDCSPAGIAQLFAQFGHSTG